MTLEYFANSAKARRRTLSTGDEMLSKQYSKIARTLLSVARNMTDQIIADQLETLARTTPDLTSNQLLRASPRPVISVGGVLPCLGYETR